MSVTEHSVEFVLDKFAVTERMPTGIKNICYKLKINGFRARFKMLNSHWAIITDAWPDDIEKLFGYVKIVERRNFVIYCGQVAEIITVV